MKNQTVDDAKDYPRIKIGVAILLMVLGVFYLGYYTIYEADASFKHTLAIALFAIIIAAIGASFRIFDLVRKAWCTKPHQVIKPKPNASNKRHEKNLRKILYGENMSEVVFEAITIEVLSTLIIAGIIGVGSFCAILYRCTHKTAKKISNLSKAFLVVVEISEEQTKRDHPEYDGNLLDKAKTILADDWIP